jgi:predicted AAA+ superfamily ATPase
LIVIDEIQEEPAALTALKYFAQDVPEYHVACAGSLLGVAAHPRTSFPVGKVNTINVYPLTFTEFLSALGEDSLEAVVRDGDLTRLTVFHDRLVSYLQRYIFVGGMPEVVQEFTTDRDLSAARTVQRELLDAYDRDFSKHAPLPEIPRLRSLFDSIPRQLARENRRFVYGQAQSGARAKTLELALAWLRDAGLVHQVWRVQTPRLPLAAYADEAAFKLFLLDTGLTATMSDLAAGAVLDSSRLFTEVKGALAEQFVLQSLIAAGLTPYYWTNKTGTAEIDFILQSDDAVIPLEVKSATNTQAKSLRVYRDTYSPPVSLRISLRPYRDDGWVVNFPLYAIDRLPDILASRTASGPA